MSTLGAILARHVDQPEDRHRLVLTGPLSLRCLDCCHSFDLRALTSSHGSTSTSQELRQPPRAGHECQHHPGEYADACRPCRADRLDGPPRQLPPVPSTPEGRAAARELADELLQAARQRRTTASTTTTTEESA